MKTVTRYALVPWGLVAAALLASGCGGDGNEADQMGVAAQCTAEADCQEVTIAGEPVQLQCLTQFKGGYCAIEDCASKADCPDGSTCVAHDDGHNYCFRSCVEKVDCNANRDADNEANCSSSFDYADAADDDGKKACIPPSGG